MNRLLPSESGMVSIGVAITFLESIIYRMRYLFGIPNRLFCQSLIPALTRSAFERNFSPVIHLCDSATMPHATALVAGSALGMVRSGGLRWSQDAWQLVAAELFIAYSAAMPRLEFPVESWLSLLRDGSESEHVIEERLTLAISGEKPLVAGCEYSPGRARWNGIQVVGGLTQWLKKNCEKLSKAAESPPGAPEIEAEEAEYSCQWFEALADLYDRANQSGWIILSEWI